MLLDPGNAGWAPSASDVDLAGDALANPSRIGARPDRFDHAREFMAQDAAELGVSLEHLEVGAADAGADDSNQTLAALPRDGNVAQGKSTWLFENEGAHGDSTFNLSVD
jgi:hypothetical protein